MEGSYPYGPGGVNGNKGSNASSAMSRAEKFEDEKRRVIESCFSKTEPDGSMLESYITHIKIKEDAAFPNSPPPLNSNPEAKKERLIIVAVRKSGRVRMHKARENGNGTFSIGKTWMLDELTALRSFSGSNPTTNEERQWKESAGAVGFIVTIGKPYYWEASSPKEKQFFVASLVKIYNKYTGGKIPELKGFDARETEQLGPAAKAAAPSPKPQQTSSVAQIPVGQPQSRPPRREPSREPIVQPQPPPVREAMPRPPPQTPNATQPFNTLKTTAAPSFNAQATNATSPFNPHKMSTSTTPPFNIQNKNAVAPFNSQAPGAPIRGRRDESPSSVDSSGAGIYQSQPNLRRLAGNNQSQESFARSDDNGSLPPRSRGGMNGLPNAPGRFQDRSVTPTPQRATTPDSVSDLAAVPSSLRVGGDNLPERRRPPLPILGDARQNELGPGDSNMIPAPLVSPGMRREELRPPVRNSERTPPRELGIDPPATNNYSLPSNEDSIKVITPEVESKLESAKTLDSPESTSKPPSIPPSLPPSTLVSPVESSPQEEENRPGLGPMIKTKRSRGDIANTFLKAAKTANAFNSFKPRAGGAAERLREAAKSPDGPDGITSVVPAPSLIRGASTESSDIPAPVAAVADTSSPKVVEEVPKVKITVPGADRPSSVQGPLTVKEATPIEKPKTVTRDVKREKTVAERMAKELASLGIDPAIIGDRGRELVDAWDDLGWAGDGVRTTNIDKMKEQIDRNLNMIQTGSHLKGGLDEQDPRVAAIMEGFDKCIDECEELDGLLTLYLVELGTLTEDIAYIEAQSQGLQVQTANQKLLQAELRLLLETIQVSPEDLASLREASLESSRGIEQIESSLVILFKAMLYIDPSLGVSGSRVDEAASINSGKPGTVGSTGISGSELGSMRVMQEKKEVYKNESTSFLRRLKPFVQVKFAAAIDETRKALERDRGNGLARTPGKVKLNPQHHDMSRNLLWRYSPIMLFSRQVDQREWEELMKTYEAVCKPLYQDEFRDATFAWKRIAKKPTGDEGDILFTSQIEKQTDGIATTARKLTVKRSQTLAKTLRSPMGESNKVDKTADGRLQPYEVFGGALDEMAPIISMEQNFFIEFFHVSSLEQHDFFDVVAGATPDTRRGGDLKRSRVMEPNRDLAKQVFQSMEEVFSFFQGDIQALVDWTIQADSLQGVGVIVAIERKLVDLEESNQEYLTRTLQKQRARLISLFKKFLDDQIRAIEDTKVKIKKRKGVIGFVRIFPSFSLALETMLAGAADLEIRETVNHGYIRINKAMFESLKVIARENPSAQAAGADPEDKEALNYQILLIENMNHYLEEVDDRSNHVLEEWKHNAEQEMEEHMSLYLGAVIRRPLGKLLDFLESTESLILSHQPGETSSKISNMPSHSKLTFKKILAGYDSKEIKKGIETLKRRVDKHFGDADDPGLSRSLVLKVQQNCEKYYEKVEDRILTISRDVYDGDVIAEWTRADVSTAFRSQGK